MTPKTPDYGHKEADKELAALVRRLHLSYRFASISRQEQLEKYLEKFAAEDKEMRALYDSGEMSHEDYMKWRMRKIAGTKQWKAMLNQLANDMTHQNEIAASMIDDTLPDVYAVNHNYGTYEAEVGSGYDTTYTMYDKHTVSRLLKENPDLLPEPTVNIPRDRLWNRQHLQSELLRGILTGASMREIAKRFQSVTDMTERSAMRNARTAVTGAENAGRIDSYKRAEKMGIKMKQMWMATLDGRTRDSHAMMDGEEQEVGKKFSNGCLYPGDPKGAPAEVYNCRCTLVAVVDGADPYNPNLRKSEYLEEEGLTYDEWKVQHSGKTKSVSNSFDRSSVNYTKFGQHLKGRLDSAGVEWREVQIFEKQPSENDIINRLCGGDITKGSCASLACAYAGNKNGLNVLDFRDGKSRDIFANGGLNDIANLHDVVAKYEPKGGVNPAKKLLKQMEEGKEYIFKTGRHAAVTRIVNGDMQYLELQSATDSGWHSFERDIIYYEGTPYERKYHLTVSELLKWRFACKGQTTFMSALIDIDSLKGNDEFRDLLGYINTEESKQRKGKSGDIK